MQKVTNTVDNTSRIIKPSDSNYRFQINESTGVAEVYHNNILVSSFDADGLHIPSGLNAYIGSGTSDPLARVADIPARAWSPMFISDMRITMGLTTCAIGDGKCRDIDDTTNMTASFTHNKLMTTVWSPSTNATPTGILPTALVGTLTDGLYLMVACSGNDGAVQYSIDNNFYLSNITATLGGSYTKFRIIGLVAYSTLLGGFVPFEMGWDDDYYRFINPFNNTGATGINPSGETLMTVATPPFSKAILKISIYPISSGCTSWGAASVYPTDQSTPTINVNNFAALVNSRDIDVSAFFNSATYSFMNSIIKEVAVDVAGQVKVLMYNQTQYKLHVQTLGYRWNRRY